MEASCIRWSKTGGAAGRNCLDSIEPPKREKDTDDASKHGQYRTFDKHLLGDLATACAESGAHSQFPFAAERARQLHICDVGAGDEKHKADCGQKECHAAFVIFHPRIEKDQRRDAASSVGIGVTTFELSGDVI